MFIVFILILVISKYPLTQYLNSLFLPRVLVHSTATYGVLAHSMHRPGGQGTAVSDAEPYAMDILMRQTASMGARRW